MFVVAQSLRFCMNSTHTEATTAGTATASNKVAKLRPAVSIQPPAMEPRMEPMRPMPSAQATPVARLAVG